MVGSLNITFLGYAILKVCLLAFFYSLLKFTLRRSGNDLPRYLDAQQARLPQSRVGDPPRLPVPSERILHGAWRNPFPLAAEPEEGAVAASASVCELSSFVYDSIWRAFLGMLGLEFFWFRVQVLTQLLPGAQLGDSPRWQGTDKWLKQRPGYKVNKH